MNGKGVTIAVAAVAGLFPTPAWPQTFDSVGTRSAGMGGAFVAVADDASAVYWNPAGLASGSYFSLVADVGGDAVRPDASAGGASRSGWLLALGAPMLGMSYARLRSSELTSLPTDPPLDGRNSTVTGPVRLSNLVTHHTGVTLVQSIAQGLDVGATLKLVRGIAASVIRPGGARDSLLEETEGLVGRATNRFDADVGVMARLGRVKAGLTVRNLTEPEFGTVDEIATLSLERQARAGLSVRPIGGWLMAADFDLVRTHGSSGGVRDLSLGTEGRLAKRALVRGGLRINTADSGDLGRSSVSVGGSYSATAWLLVDAEVTTGSDRAARGWGVSGRLVY